MRLVRISLFPGIPKVLGFYDFYDSFIDVFAAIKANENGSERNLAFVFRKDC